MNLTFTLNRTVEVEQAASTQDIAKELAGIYKEDCVLVQARTQTNGRGRYERGWSAGEGGLYISIVLRPARAGGAAALSVKTGEAVAQTLGELYGIKTKIKLPNDVLALQRGTFRKIAGILIEASYDGDAAADWLVVGIGVNLNNKPPRALGAATVATITRRPVDIKEFRDALVKNFAAKYLQWQLSAGA